MSHRWRATVAPTLAAVAVAIFTLLLPRSATLDLFAFDAWHRLTGQRGVATRTAIVAIDDASLERFRDTPLAFWQPQLAAAIQNLRKAGVKIIGVDLIQGVSAETWLTTIGAGDTLAGRSYEASYREALTGGDIVLAAALSARAGEPDLLPPTEYIDLLPQGVDDLGLVNLVLDGDGFTRRISSVLADSAPSLAFSARLAQAVEPYRRPGTGQTLIPFLGPPGTVPRVSLATLTLPNALLRADVQALHGRVVIIAVDATRLQDLQLTPYARALPGMSPQLMTGGEVHAQAVEAWLGHREIVSINPQLLICIAAGLGFAMAVAALRYQPTTSAGLALLCALGSLLASGYLFVADFWMHPTPLLAAIAGAWSTGLASRAARDTRARNSMRKMFARYVSDEVADLAVRDALPDAAGSPMAVTVLFVDIRNFTVMSEKLDSHEVFELLNAWLAKACPPILANRGNVDKFIGDAVMAIFGSPVPLADHAKRAIEAAQSIALAADEFSQWAAHRFAGRDLPPFAIGIGLHSGLVAAGNLGTARRVEFTAIGDTVNVASRLESASKELGWRIVASADTVLAAGPGLQLGRQKAIALKGKSVPLAVVEIPYQQAPFNSE